LTAIIIRKGSDVNFAHYFSSKKASVNFFFKLL